MALSNEEVVLYERLSIRAITDSVRSWNLEERFIKPLSSTELEQNLLLYFSQSRRRAIDLSHLISWFSHRSNFCSRKMHHLRSTLSVSERLIRNQTAVVPKTWKNLARKETNTWAWSHFWARSVLKFRKRFRYSQNIRFILSYTKTTGVRRIKQRDRHPRPLETEDHWPLPKVQERWQDWGKTFLAAARRWSERRPVMRVWQKMKEHDTSGMLCESRNIFCCCVLPSFIWKSRQSQSLAKRMEESLPRVLWLEDQRASEGEGDRHFRYSNPSSPETVRYG